jgi:hypothetical protein
LRKIPFPYLNESLVDEAFEALGSLFSSKEEFINYLNSFKNPKNVELLIDVTKFYLIAKKYHPQSYIKLIMMISVMEKLVNQYKKFQEFYEWIEDQDDRIKELLSSAKTIDVDAFKNIIRKLKNEYFQCFGSRRNVTTFFEKHFDKEDKVKLVRAIRANWTDFVERFIKRIFRNLDFGKVTSIQELKEKGFVVEEGYMPYCYDWKQCWVEYGECHPDCGCSIRENISLLNECVREVVNKLYQMRSDFIHNATLTMLNEKDAIFTLATSGGKPILIELTAEDLQGMFEKALKHYFDSLIQGTG